MARHSFGGGRSHSGSKPGPDRAKMYDTAAKKANDASAHATAQDTPHAHKAAARAHEVAANAAGKAGIQMRVSGHAQQAAVHNMKASAKAASAQVSKGSFGTDPATGNSQSKAKVLDPRLGPVHRSELKGGSRIAGPMKGEAEHMAHEKASISATRATMHANAAGTASAHAKASAAHSKAVKTAIASGNNAAENHHTREANQHRLVAKEGGMAKLNHGVQTGGGAHNASHIGVHPVMLGQEPKGRGLGRVNAKGERVTGHRANATGLKTSSAKTNPLNASQQHVAGDSAFKNHDTQHASTFAHTQSAKAAAKPSLASHSLAAKAHDKAALAHGGATSPQGRDHLLYAISHREQARAHSQRIMKLKKLGPGQHHGRGGRFEGTPGGAK